jgi:hypothetical protein
MGYLYIRSMVEDCRVGEYTYKKGILIPARRWPAVNARAGW